MLNVAITYCNNYSQWNSYNNVNKVNMTQCLKQKIDEKSLKK